MDGQSRLLLIDGHAVAYRAFYAIRDLATRAGAPTNAVYGFIRMLQQLNRQWSPTHEVVVFDGGLPAERMELLATYKAQREAMPDALSTQFPLIEEFLEAARIPMIREDQQEADDVMATLAVEARTRGADVLLATSDKDMYQLVEDNVSIIPPTKSDVRMGPEAVREKTGVGPASIAEWLALIGDASDNIPGVPGVGPKTAAKLLNAHASIEGVYERLDDIKQDKLREALKVHRSDVLRNLQMTRLRTDLPLTMNWDAWVIRNGDYKTLHAFYKRMEFNSMAKELESPSLFSE